MPAKFRAAFVAAPFFRGDGVLRKVFSQPRNNGLLRAFIRLRYQVNVALVRDLRRPVKLFAKDFACFLGDFNRGFEIVLAHGKMADAAPIRHRGAPARSPLYHQHGRKSCVQGNEIYDLRFLR